jgi:hypothetical protein
VGFGHSLARADPKVALHNEGTKSVGESGNTAQSGKRPRHLGGRSFDFATLKHLAGTGMGANTLRALASDLAYLEALCRAAAGGPLPWPADPELVLKFVAHHMWDPDQRAIDAAHCMPDDVAEDHGDWKILKVKGTHAPKTVSRRLSNWSTLHQWKGVEPLFEHPGIRKALYSAMRTSA